jgi:hypothetical protein
METKEKQSTTEAPRYRNVYGSGKFKWAIYPDYWKQSWGQKPMLGIIYADDEFYAEREAYSKGLLPVNFTIRPHAVKIGEAKPRPPRFNNHQTFNKE